MNNLHELIQSCQKCDLHKLLPEGCLPVPGVGPINAKLVMVGEALGENEVTLQEPFVGLAGEMLNTILKEADINRSECYITNVVKCRPFEGNKNRAPNDSEILACKSWLWKELKLIQPKLIVTLGRVPTQLLLKMKKCTMFKVVGESYTVDYISSTIYPLYHPSFLMQHGRQYINKCVEILKNVKTHLT